MAARRAAEALVTLVRESGTHEYTLDTFGPGVFYRAFANEEQARAYASAPVVDDRVTYSTGDRVAMCGEMAVGLITLHPQATIAVVDIVDESQRCTLRHGAEPLVQSIDLVPAPPEAVVDRLPEPIADNDETCARVEAALANIFAREPTNDDRRIYYIDARIDNLDNGESFDCISVEDDFSATLKTLQRAVSAENDSPLTTPLTLQRVEQLHAEHDPREHVVAWLKMNDDVDVVWLVDRRLKATS